MFDNPQDAAHSMITCIVDNCESRGVLHDTLLEVRIEASHYHQSATQFQVMLDGLITSEALPADKRVAVNDLRKDVIKLAAFFDVVETIAAEELQTLREQQ